MKLVDWFFVILGMSAIYASAGVCAAGSADIRENFEISALDSMKNFEVMAPDPASVLLDSDVYHSGKASVKVRSAGADASEGGMVGIGTKPIPYRGQLIKVSAWMKTKDVVVGSLDWLMAGIQVYSLNSDGKVIGHTDITLKSGTNDWAEYQGEFRLSRAVAYVKLVCHLWGDSKGTVWFDDVSFRLEDDRLSLAHRTVDMDKATVTVDFSKRLGEFRHLWEGTDACYTDRAATQSGINAMRLAKQIGFRYIRLHECIVNTRVYSEDSRGNPIYNWELLDSGIRAIVDNGLLPVIVLETMPPELAGRNSGHSWTNPYAPKDTQAYLKWQELVYQLVKHCAQKWGQNIHKWYFEIWNEPDASGYFTGTLEEYLRIYDHAVAGATRADPKIVIGGVGGAGAGWSKPFLEHCIRGRNDATGKTGTRTDFFSWHIYTVGTGIPVFDSLYVSLETVKSTIKKFPEYSKLPLLITEWGCSSSLFAPHDRPYDAAFRAMAVKAFMDSGVQLAMPFCLAETPYGTMQGFRGDLGLYTQTTIPKPSARVFELLDWMRGDRLSLRSSNEPIDGLACISRNQKEFQVLLYNLVEDYTRPAYTTSVKIKLKNLPAGRWICKIINIAPAICDPYTKWLELGSPDSLTSEQQEAILEASQLPEPVTAAINNGIVQIYIRGFSVAMLKLQKVE